MISSPKRFFLILTVFLLVLVTGSTFYSCDEAPSASSVGANNTKSLTNQSSEGTMTTFTETDQATEYVRITMENGHTIVIRLLPQYVPITVTNFQELVSRHFYDGLIFHRVMSGFMIQGGDPKGNGTGGSDKTIKGEFIFEVNGQRTIIPHQRGVVSMARGKDPDSASSQFFICHADAPHLNGQYAAFGFVVQGMATVDEIAAVETDANDKPLVDQRMRTVRFVTPNK